MYDYFHQDIHPGTRTPILVKIIIHFPVFVSFQQSFINLYSKSTSSSSSSSGCLSFKCLCNAVFEMYSLPQYSQRFLVPLNGTACGHRMLSGSCTFLCIGCSQIPLFLGGGRSCLFLIRGSCYLGELKICAFRAPQKRC